VEQLPSRSAIWLALAACALRARLLGGGCKHTHVGQRCLSELGAF